MVSLVNQSCLSGALEWQGLGYILTLDVRETQKVTFDLYFQEVDFRRPEILQKPEGALKVRNSQSMEKMPMTLEKQVLHNS